MRGELIEVELQVKRIEILRSDPVAGDSSPKAPADITARESILSRSDMDPLY